MKKSIRILLSIFLCLVLTTSAFAHSGRTDSGGGHNDNKNASGLGYYHYHHGYGPHLHTNGVCPYLTSVTTSTTGTSSQKTNSTSVTDVKAYINNAFIPSVNYKNYTYIIAEDLSDYGFNVVWDGIERTLKISRNTTKEISSLSSSNTSETYSIESTDIKTYLYDSVSDSYELIESYNIDGETIVKFSDIGDAVWNGTARTSSITLN